VIQKILKSRGDGTANKKKKGSNKKALDFTGVTSLVEGKPRSQRKEWGNKRKNRYRKTSR